MRFSNRRLFFIVGLVIVVATMVPYSVRADAPPTASQITLVSGNISVLTATSVTVQMPDGGKTVTYSLAPSPIILIDGVPKSIADLKAGLIANVVSAGGVATEIDARTPDTDAWGVIASVSPTSITVTTEAGETASFTINAATRVSIFSKIVTVADLKTDMFAHVTDTFDHPGTASAIEVVRPDNGVTRGKITAVDANSITLQSRKGDSTTFTINAKTTVTQGDKPEKITDVHSGQYASVTTPDGMIATAITLLDPPPFAGRHGGDSDGDGDGT